MTDTSTAVAIVEQSAESGVIEWNLDGFPEDRFNRLLPVATLQVPTDLLRPVVQVVQANPDPKNGGDVYTSRDMPEGHAAPTRVLLRKFATAAGISFVDERRTDDGTNPDVIEVSCVAEMLLPTGQRIRATGTKRVDLNAQVWASANHKAKYKSFFLEHVASRAQNRAIRALLSLRGSYPLEVYRRPFAVVSFAPNMNHPEVRSRMLDAMTGAAAALYGPPAARQLGAGQTVDVTPAAEEDPAPAPTALPGETLAKAETAGSDDELPDWAKPVDAARRSIAEALRSSAEASEMKGALTKPQRERLRELTTGFNFTAEFLPLLERAGFDAAALTAAQANAVISVADSFDSVDAFRDAWKAEATA